MDGIGVKICCIKSRQELRMALDEGIRTVGFVSKMPSGPGIISDEAIRNLIRFTSAAVDTFLLSSRKDVKDVIEQCRYCRPSTIQLCYPFAAEKIFALRDAIPTVNVVPVVHVTSLASSNRAHRLLKKHDSVLLDTGRPKAKVPTLGGTGRVHDWEVSKAIRNAWPDRYIWLAGGLTAANVAMAISLVRPSGVDICSGVRTNDHLDHVKLREFLDSVRDHHV